MAEMLGALSELGVAIEDPVAFDPAVSDVNVCVVTDWKFCVVAFRSGGWEISNAMQVRYGG